MVKTKKLLAFVIIISIFASMSAIGASANEPLAYGAATVDTQVLNLRSGPGLSHEVLTTLTEGDIIVILERTSSEWFPVNFHGTVGYVSTPFLRDILVAENFSAIGRIVGSWVNIRERPNTTSDILAAYPVGAVMTVIGINDGWYKISHDGHIGYVRSDFMEIIDGTRPSGAADQSTSTNSGATSTQAADTAPPANLTLGQQIVEFALGYLGHRYVWGGTSPSGFDCSGFTTYVYRHFGYSISRTAHDQFVNNGVSVAKSDLAPGDLLFFSSNGGSRVTHVGIYIGDNEFVHASTSTTGVIVSRLDSAYYVRVWHGAKRLI